MYHFLFFFFFPEAIEYAITTQEMDSLLFEIIKFLLQVRTRAGFTTMSLLLFLLFVVVVVAAARHPLEHKFLNFFMHTTLDCHYTYRFISLCFGF